MKEIVNLQKINQKQPASWFGVSNDGTQYYFKYSRGILKIHSSEDGKPYKNSPERELVVDNNSDDELSESELQAIVKFSTSITFDIEDTLRPEMEELLAEG